MTTAEQQQDDQTGAMTEREQLAKAIFESINVPRERYLIDLFENHPIEFKGAFYRAADAILAAGFTITRAAPSDAVVVSRNDLRILLEAAEAWAAIGLSGGYELHLGSLQAALAATQEQVTP